MDVIKLYTDVELLVKVNSEMIEFPLNCYCRGKWLMEFGI